jgi:hypothetical protein
MSRTLVNFCLDALLLVITLGVIWTSCVLKLVFPPATRAVGWTLWGMGYDGWSDVQCGLLAAVALAILVHLMMHWSWVCGVIAARLLRRGGKADDGVRTLYGVGTLIVLIVITTGFLIAAELALRPPPP